MHKQDIAVGALLLELARRLDKGLRLDVADSAADFGDYDVSVGLLGNAIQTFLNGVGYMRDNLHGATQEVAAAFTGNEALVNGALGEVRFARKALIDEALVMAQVKVTLMAVVGKRLGTVLGPRGKMPKPIAPGADPAAMIDSLRKSVTIRTKDRKTFHAPVGTVDMTAEEIAENVDLILKRVESHLEKGKHNIASAYVKTTMGPSERVL